MRDIALVDDDELYREALSADLSDRGFVVSAFAGGSLFLDALNSGLEPDAALLDWAMLDISGLALLHAMRQRGIKLPVVFLTRYAVIERELQALDDGAVDFVDKARGVDVLAHRMRVVIAGQRGFPLDAEARRALAGRCRTSI